MHIADVKFFETGITLTNPGSRFYSTRFKQSRTRYVGYEVLLMDCPHYAFNIKTSVCFYDKNGVLFGKTINTYSFPMNYGTCNFSAGWGWAQAGNWKIGKYKIQIWLNDIKSAKYFIEIV